MIITGIFEKDGAYWRLSSGVDWYAEGFSDESQFRYIDDLTPKNFDVCGSGFRQLFGERVDTTEQVRVSIGNNPPDNIQRHRLEPMRSLSNIWKIKHLPEVFCGGPTPWPAVVDLALTEWNGVHPDEPLYLWAQVLNDDISWPVEDMPTVGPAANPITGISINLTLFQAEQALRRLREQGIEPELIPIYDALVQFEACLDNEEETT